VASAQNSATLNVEDDDINVTPSYIDSTKVTDSATGKVSYKKIRGRTSTVSYRSGMQIFKENEATEPVAKAAQESIDQFFRNLYSDELAKTNDALDYIVILIDENGKIDLLNTNFYVKDSDEVDIMRKGMWNKIKDLTFTPAKKDGKPVPYLVTILGRDRRAKK